ncbi:MAG: polyferredoxin, heterodixulfide reductase subunit A [Candidatus Bathyarchaeota archaeon B23]|nr:MAG: polyferredoxin, heterodixulfide reductase subunit A [Candidatus Bathyarchaeota archaeon B23]
MIGVFICRCGGNISGTVDCDKVRDIVKGEADVAVARVHDFLCSKPGLEMIREAIRRRKLEKVVVACCSPHMHEETFRRAVEEAGLNRHLLVHVNVREQCSWVHREGATEKALSLIKAGINRARALEPLEEVEVEVRREVLVVGGGIAGITASLQVAASGLDVHLVERRPSIGGRMAQLSKTFPTLDCAPCILSPKMAEVEANPRIRVITNAEVASVSGGPGDFNVAVRVKPRGVDAERCLKCGRCASVCPVEVPDEFEEGLYRRKAIYLPFPQAVPSSYAVDFEHCTRCGACVEACPADAIDLDEPERVEELRVGAIIVATGFDLLDAERLRNYHPEHPDVVTSLQLERLIERELAEGRVLRRSDGGRVKSVAYILCAGSRDPHRGVPYCSAVCCPYTIKQAILLKEYLPYLKIWVYYTDMRMSGRGFETFYAEARERGVEFIHGRPGEVEITEGGMGITAEDIDTGLLIRNRVDLVVLCPALIPSRGLEELASKLGIPLGEDLFVAPRHPKLDPISTLRRGVYAAGAALGPKDIHESVVDAMAAASKAYELLGEGRLRLSPYKPIYVGGCDGCGVCVEVCPLDAIKLEDETPRVDLVSCDGCGACVSRCPRGALRLPNYTAEGLLSEVEALISGAEEPVVVGLFDDEISYTAADSAGTARLSYSTAMRIVRIPSTALLEGRLLLGALALGADGVMICEAEGTARAELTERLVEEMREELRALGVEEERLHFKPMYLPIYKMLPRFIDEYVERIRRLGRVPREARERLRERVELKA